jgi:cytochrome P450
MYGPGLMLFFREVVAEHDIKGVPMTPGTLLNIMFTPNNYNPLYYNNPFEFNPERWIDNNNNTIKHPYTFVPFSGGQRNCIGQHLAMLETRVILIKMMKRYLLTIEKPEEMYLKVGFLLEPTEFKTIVIKRDD